MARLCTRRNRRLSVLFACLLLAACGGQRVETAASDNEAIPAASGDSAGGNPEPAASVPDPVDCVPPAQVFEEDPLLDKAQKQVYQVVYHSARWFDGLFGSSDVHCAGSVSRGYIGPGMRYDQRDGFKAQLRFRADIALPALSKRANLVIGRVDTDDFVDGSADDNINSLPGRFNEFSEQDLVLGLGFNNIGGLRKGWDFGVGVKLRAPPEPFARLRYHWNPIVSDRWLWRVTPMLFAQGNRGKGVSLTSVIDYALSDRWLFRSWMIGTVEDEVEGTAWTGKLTAFQSLKEQSAIGYSIYANGETENEVELLDYGFEVRYRRSLFRRWFFVELTSSLSWPREFLEEERETNIGVGVEFNLFFGEDFRVRR